MQDILEGKPLAAPALRYVDVRDVAAAHVAAAEVSEAKGRYLLGYHSTVPARDISDALQVPSTNVPWSRHILAVLRECFKTTPVVPTCTLWHRFTSKSDVSG